MKRVRSGWDNSERVPTFPMALIEWSFQIMKSSKPNTRKIKLVAMVGNSTQMAQFISATSENLPKMEKEN